MTYSRIIAPWREWHLLAKWFRKSNATDEDRKLPKAISAHIARDIGLSEAEIERVRHRWPSQHTHHPML